MGEWEIHYWFRSLNIGAGVLYFFSLLQNSKKLTLDPYLPYIATTRKKRWPIQKLLPWM